MFENYHLLGSMALIFLVTRAHSSRESKLMERVTVSFSKDRLWLMEHWGGNCKA